MTSHAPSAGRGARPAALLAALVLAPALACSCGPSVPPLPPEPERCTYVGADDAGAPTASVTPEVGAGSGASFVPWSDGDTVRYTRGGQGAFMVTPTVRIPAAAVPPAATTSGGAKTCMRIRLRNEVAEITSGLAGQFEMVRAGEAFEAVGIFNPLDGPLDGSELVLGVAVSGHGLAGERTVRVRLAPE